MLSHLGIFLHQVVTFARVEFHVIEQRPRTKRRYRDVCPFWSVFVAARNPPEEGVRLIQRDRVDIGIDISKILPFAGSDTFEFIVMEEEERLMGGFVLFAREQSPEVFPIDDAVGGMLESGEMEKRWEEIDIHGWLFTSGSNRDFIRKTHSPETWESPGHK